MKAIILNSGVAKRLKPLTDNLPKCLLEVNGRTILGRQLECLEACGIDDIIITTGPFEDQIVHFMEENFPGLRVSFVNNPNYASTNYIYSIWLAKELITEDIALLHGDLIFDCPLLNRIASKKSGNYVLVDNVVEPPEKDFKARVEKGRIKEIGVNVTGENAYFCPPLYKLNREGIRRWTEQMGEFIRGGNVNCYAEDAFNAISDELTIRPFYYAKERCMEIDSFEDLEEARIIFR